MAKDKYWIIREQERLLDATTGKELAGAHLELLDANA